MNSRALRVLDFCNAAGLGLLSYKIPSRVWHEWGPTVGLALIFTSILLGSSAETPKRDRPRPGGAGREERSIDQALRLLLGWLLAIGGAFMLILNPSQSWITALGALAIAAALVVPVYYAERRARPSDQ